MLHTCFTAVGKGLWDKIFILLLACWAALRAGGIPCPLTRRDGRRRHSRPRGAAPHQLKHVRAIRILRRRPIETRLEWHAGRVPIVGCVRLRARRFGRLVDAQPSPLRHWGAGQRAWRSSDRRRRLHKRFRGADKGIGFCYRRLS
jgi:hypothetical protein